MHTFKLAICDHLDFYKSILNQHLNTYKTESGINFHIDSWDNALDFLNFIMQNHTTYDLVFFRIMLPDITGLEAAHRLRLQRNDTPICFVTTHTEYAYQAYQVDALDFLQGPIQYKRLIQVLLKAKYATEFRKRLPIASPNCLSIVYKRHPFSIHLEDVLYIEKRKNQSIFHFADKEIACYNTLSHLYTYLNKKMFVYVHQGYIVNLSYIVDLLPDHILFGSGIKVPVSRRFYPILKEHLENQKHNRIFLS